MIATPTSRSACDWATQRVTQGVSLLSMTEENGTSTLTVHREVAEVVIDEAPEPDDAVWIAALDEAEAAEDSEAVGWIGYRPTLRAM